MFWVFDSDFGFLSAITIVINTIIISYSPLV